jgi:hypothetical protein
MKKVRFPENIYIPIVPKKCIICKHRNIPPKIRQFKKCNICYYKVCEECYISRLKMCIGCNSIFRQDFSDSDSIEDDLYLPY